MQNVPGIEKVVFKAVSGSAFNSDVEISGTDLSDDTTAELEQIMITTAGGGVRHQGNRQFDFEMQCLNPDHFAALEPHRNVFGEMEIYELGETAIPTLTLKNVNPRLDENVSFDPADDGGAAFTIGIQGINRIA